MAAHYAAATFRDRWMTVADVPAALACFAPDPPDGLDANWLLSRFGKDGVISKVLTGGPRGRVAACLVYRLFPRWIRIDAIGVRSAYRRKGLGMRLLNWIRDLTVSSDRRCLRCIAPDDRLPLHLLLSSAGMLAERVVPDHRRKGEYAYDFAWYSESLKKEAP